MQHTDKQKVLFLAKQEALERDFEGVAAEAFVMAFVKNFEKGEKIGAEKERAKADAEKRENAEKMLADGLSLELISKYSGLSLDELNDL